MPIAAKAGIILDTNIIISGILFKGDMLRRLVARAMNQYQLIFSNETWDELAEVIQRNQFEKNLALGLRLRALAELARYAEIAEVKTIVTDCRDPKDNKFLSLALDADVRVIVTGDSDLKELHPFKGIEIYAPVEFMVKHEASS